MIKTTKRGRPRAFDKDSALEKALQVFIDKGYEGASIDDLTGAMGINKPSMYSAFGNKEELFLKVLSFYTEPHQEQLRKLFFSAPTAYDAFETFFQGLVKNMIASRNCNKKMGGCLLVNSTILSCREETSISQFLKNHHDNNENLFYERLQQGIEQGDLSADKDPRAMAQYFNGVLQGIAVLSRAQQSETSLQNIASTALQILK